MRGDNIHCHIFIKCSIGSPPHAWGQSQIYLLSFLFGRFTPTCVGTMLDTGTSILTLTVHPHMRGDNFYLLYYLSSFQRFTPTCVGTIPFGMLLIKSFPVHPHMRGDNKFSLTVCQSWFGSPPHAWGQYG